MRRIFLFVLGSICLSFGIFAEMNKKDIKSMFVKIEERQEIMKTEVTQELYEEIMGTNPSSWDSVGNQKPVNNVSWLDAVIFCNKLSLKMGFEPVYDIDGDSVTWDESDKERDGYRLPTADEWQNAARGDGWYKYSGSNNVEEVGWILANSNDTLQNVGTKKPNSFGIFDMTGNVSEWCWDLYNRDYRVFLGGSYSNRPVSIEEKSAAYQNSKYANLGFRVIRGPKYIGMGMYVY